MNKATKNQIGMLPILDQHIYNGIKTNVDEMKESNLIKSSIQAVLGVKVPMQLESGERVEVGVREVLVAETIKDAISKPSTSKLKDIAMITGEMNQTIDLNVQTPQQLFGDIVVKK